MKVRERKVFSNRRKTYMLILAVVAVSLIMEVCPMLPADANNEANSSHESGIITLPEPEYESETSVEEALLERRSVRDYKNGPLSLQEVSRLLWSGQGVTDPGGFRTAPSAGALYPLEIYVVAGEVRDLPEGVYKYSPQEHGLVKIAEGDRRAELSRAALGQEWVREGKIVIVFGAVYERTTAKYGQRGTRYVHIEVGCAAQNVYLQAVSLHLGTVFVGAFYDEEVKKVLDMEEKEQPLGIMPVGKR